MASAEKDILVEIPKYHLLRLALFYRENAPEFPHMVNLVKTGMNLKLSDDYKDAIVFYSPNNCWEEDGTVIILITLHTHEIYVFTLDENCTNLEKGLSETKLIQYKNRKTVFYAINDKHFPTIKRHIEDRKLKVIEELPCFLYAIPPEDAEKFTIELPSDVYMKRLDVSHCKQIDSLWPHRFPNSHKYTKSLIALHGGYGIFLKSTDRMVSWVTRHAFGNMTILQTEIEHKRKGYATLVTKALAKEIANDGLWAYAMVITSNAPADNTFQKLGFKLMATTTFLVAE